MDAPAFLVARQSRNVSMGAVQGIGGPSPARISIAAQRFTKVDSAGNQKPHTVVMTNQQGQPQEFIAPFLDCVLVGVNHNVSKTYYDSAYDPNADDAPPACWSDNGTGPSSLAAKPQARTCAECPHNVWGSAVSNMTGKPTKACNDAKKIALLIPNDPIIYQLRIPPATLKNLKQYAHTVGSNQLNAGGEERRADLSDVVTRISFESQGVLKFEPIQFIDEIIAAQMNVVTDEKLNGLLGINDVARNPALPIGPTAPAQIAAPQMQPVPQQPQGYQQPQFPQPTGIPQGNPGLPAQFAPQPQAPNPNFGANPAFTPPPQSMVPVAPQQPVAPSKPRGRPKAAAPAQAPQQPAQAVVLNGGQHGTTQAMMMPQAPLPTNVMPPAAGMAPAPAWQPPAQQGQPPAPPPAFLQPQAQPAAPAPQFGMQANPPAPNAEMMAALDQAINFGQKPNA